MKKGMRCFISGKVQGVWFRAHTKEEADKLAITGYAKNLADGRVEVRAFGEDVSLDLLNKWLHQGSPKADVNEVTRENLPWEEYKNFSIG